MQLQICFTSTISHVNNEIITIGMSTECSKLQEWYRDPFNECAYYECDGKLKFKRACGKGTSVPLTYVDGSGASPCSIMNTGECGKDVYTTLLTISPIFSPLHLLALTLSSVIFFSPP